MSAKKSDTRIYTVTAGDDRVLVRATSQAQALRHVARNMFDVRVSSQHDIVDHLETGGKIETANEQLDAIDDGNGETK